MMEFFEKNSSKNNDAKIQSSYVIVIKNHETSERLGARCIDSCNKEKMPWERWDAFDGTTEKIKIPEKLKNQKWLKWIKITNPALLNPELCCFLSHISLWAHCVELDQSIVIFEHDAICVKQIKQHLAYNTICYLGCRSQYEDNSRCLSIPPMWNLGQNFLYMNKTHAYSIDPVMAKRLLSKVIEHGIHAPVDTFIRCDIFTQVQFGVFAYEKEYETTTAVGRDERNKDSVKQAINHKIIF